MTNQLNQAVKTYRAQWQALMTNRADRSFFEKLQPTAVGWKTEDLAEFDRIFAELRERCDQIHVAWINERWLATMNLKSSELEWKISIIKLMQRRPGSSDAVGLDHVDFLTPKAASMSEAQKILEKEPDLKWTHETNNPHCSWLSVWFANTEAKLRNDTVLDVCIAELSETNSRLL